jgi:hypothetical protein
MNKELFKERQLEDVLEGYAVETPTGNDREILKRWMKEFPDYAEDLMDFAATRATIKFSPEPVLTNEEEIRYKKSGLENLRSFLKNKEKKSESLSSLTDLAKSLGMNKGKLAATLGLSLSLVMYLEKRRLRFASIPNEIISRLAEALKTSEQAVAEYLLQGQRMATNTSFKSETRPDLPEERTLNILHYSMSMERQDESESFETREDEDDDRKSFAKAVNEDQSLSSAQKGELLALVSKE